MVQNQQEGQEVSVKKKKKIKMNQNVLCFLNEDAVWLHWNNPTFIIFVLTGLRSFLFSATSFMKLSSCAADSDIFWGVALIAHLETQIQWKTHKHKRPSINKNPKTF